jgi:hypothetical protein
MNDYNELIVMELDEVSKALTRTLQQMHSYDKRGVAAMLLQSAAMADGMAGGYKPTPEDAGAVKACLDTIAAYPGSLSMLLGQLGKTFAMAHMGFFGTKGQP